MHLSPVKAAVQLRPNFYYYDTVMGGDKRKKPQTEDGPTKQPRAVQVTLWHLNRFDILATNEEYRRYSRSKEFN